MTVSVYQFAINNTKNYIRSAENQHKTAIGEGLSVFQAAPVLAIAFMVDSAKVVTDLISSE